VAAELRSIDRPGDFLSAGGIVNVKHRVFRTALGDPDGDLSAIGRSQEIIDGIGFAAVGRTKGGNVDEFSRTCVISDDQIEIIRSGGALFVEPRPAESHIALNQVPKLAENFATSAFRFASGLIPSSNRSRIGALRLHPFDRRRIESFHVTVVVREPSGPKGFQ